MVLLAMHGVRVVGQNAVVIGKSRMVGTPMAAMLSSGGATVTQCDVHTERTTLERKVSAWYRIPVVFSLPLGTRESSHLQLALSCISGY